MKEASGELSMTAITVVAIVAVGTLFTAFVWPSIQSTIKRNAQCAAADCTCTETETTCNCVLYDEDGNVENANLICPNKSAND